jgi:DNA-binding beta-propeller fold protein YncE
MKNITLKLQLRQFTSTLSGRWSALAALCVILISTTSGHAQAKVTTIGGGSIAPPYSGFLNGNTLTTAKFSMPCGMALDASGNLYIADYTNNAVRLVSAAGNSGSVTTTWATNGVSRPVAIVLDGAGDVYVLNHGTGNNGAVLHFTGAGGTAAAQPNLASGLVNATAMAIDGNKNLYVTVNGNQVIRVTPTGVVTNIGTISQSGTSLQGIVMLDSAKLALTDAGNNGIWIMDPVAGTSTKLTGFNGAADVLGASTVAAFHGLETIAEAGGGTLVVADRGNNKVKLVDTGGNVTLLYGVSSNLWETGSGKYPGWADGTAGAVKGDAESRLPYGVAIGTDGSVFVDEDYYDVLRHVTGTGLTGPPSPGSPGSSSGSGPVTGQTYGSPAGIAYDSVDNFLFIANTTNNALQILNLNVTTNATSTFASAADGVTNPVDVLLDTQDNIYVLNQGKNNNGYILEFDIYGNAYGPIVTGLNKPTAFTMDGLGNLFVTEQSSNIFTFGAGVSNTIVTITNAGASLQGIALFNDGTLAVSDAGNQVIWSVNPITRIVSRLTGRLGVSGVAVGNTNFAEFNNPHQLVRVGGDQLVGADYGNNRLVLISRTGTVTTNHFNPVIGATIWFGDNYTDPVTGTNTEFVPMVSPFGVAVDSSGDIFDSESFYGDIRELTDTTLTGPTSNPGVPLPVYSSPAGMSLNNESTLLFVADPVNDTISALDFANNTTTVFLNSSNGIYEPVGVAVDVNDNVYVLNQGTGGNGSIMEFDEYGNFLGTNFASLPMPTAMKMTFGGDFYVSELNGLVQVLSPGSSNTLANITVNGNVRLEGIAQLDTGSVVVSDAGNDVVWMIAPGATNATLFTGILGTPGTTFGAVGFAKLNAPMGLAQAKGGLLAIADGGNNRIVVANDSGTIISALNSTNADVWFGLPTDPLTSSSPNFVHMLSPVGLVLDANGTAYDSESVYRDIRGILDSGLTPPVKPAPPTAPRIGWFDYEENSQFELVSVLHPVTMSTFNNAIALAIDPTTNGVSTYYVAGPAPLNDEPSANHGSTPPFYQDGILAYGVDPMTQPVGPDFVINAINIDSIGQESPITTAEFIFQVGNPTVNGFNGAQFTVSDVTTNSQLWYTLDGTDPTNASPSIGPLALDLTNAVVLSLVVNSNVNFKVRAFRDGYFPSGIAEQFFSPSNFVANTISFGFASGEASSAFVASAGETFYAPVTLTTLSGTLMYSLQFNIVVTNAGPNPGPAVGPGAFGFQSMLMKPLLQDPGLFVPIPPYMFIGDETNALNTNQIVTYQGNSFVNLLTVDSAINLLGVGWLERYTKTNLYPTLAQTLITYSLAHDDLFPNKNEPNEVIVGGYSFQVPTNAANNQTYQLQIGRPSATSDGIGAPGSSVYIADPTNGNLAAGAPINALKYVTVGQIKYLVGSVYPFGWFNAGDFGSSNIINADVEQVFESAIYLLNMPPPGSDFFDAMDSCGNFGALDGNTSDPDYGYYTNSNVGLSRPGQTSALFNGDDTTINQIAFGDGTLDVCDVYVTFRRSLDPSLTWFRRFWNNGQLVADTGAPNIAANVRKAPSSGSPVTSKALNTSATVAPQVNFSAGDVIGSAGTTVQVPINATILGSYPLRVLMLNLSVVPLDGSPDLTSPVSFSQVASTLGAPYITSSDGNDNFAAAWLDSTNSGLTGTVTLGTLFITIPSTASGTAAYAIHFDHASASPNGIASFPNQKLTGLITTTARTNSTYGDGIPDSWRLIWFGTVNNVLSASNACPSGDGVPNWEKYVAGVDPNVANDFPSTTPKTPVPAGSTTAIQWPSVYGTKYVIQRANNLFNGPWSILSTNTGTGGEMEYDDANTANLKFYRVEILPP